MNPKREGICDSLDIIGQEFDAMISSMNLLEEMSNRESDRNNNNPEDYTRVIVVLEMVKDRIAEKHWQILDRIDAHEELKRLKEEPWDLGQL